MPNASHAGRVVLVSGASSGVGAHVARLLAAAGAKVALGARRTDRLETLKAEITATGGDAMAVAMDVAEEASVTGAYDAVEAHFGPVDTVVANAGVNVLGPALDLAIEDFDQIMGVNLRGVFITAREGARRMISSGVQGRILLVASMGATKVLPGLAAYCASKAGVVMLGRSLAGEWARHEISVNMLCPGYMLTEINDDWFATEAGRKMVSRFPRQRLMPLEGLDPSVLYLTSDAARYTTGAVLTVEDAQGIY